MMLGFVEKSGYPISNIVWIYKSFYVSTTNILNLAAPTVISLAAALHHCHCGLPVHHQQNIRPVQFAAPTVGRIADDDHRHNTHFDDVQIRAQHERVHWPCDSIAGADGGRVRRSGVCRARLRGTRDVLHFRRMRFLWSAGNGDVVLLVYVSNEMPCVMR